MRITTAIQVRFSDVDLACHVHNAVYLHYFELGRMDLLRQVVGKDHDWLRTGLILARNEVDYRRPIRLADPLQVQTWCAKIGGKSFDLRYEIQHAEHGALFAEGRSVMVCYDYAARQSMPMPSTWRTALARLMASAGPTEPTP